MSRHAYTEEEDFNGQFAMWRGQVMNSIRGRRGQALLRDLVMALDAMPEKRLIAEELYKAGEVCALGCVGLARGVLSLDLDPEDYDSISRVFNISRQLAMEIVWRNDEDGPHSETPEQRWQRMRAWAVKHLVPR